MFLSFLKKSAIDDRFSGLDLTFRMLKILYFNFKQYLLKNQLGTCTSARKNGQKKALIAPHLPVELCDPPQGSHSEEGKLDEQLLCAHLFCLHCTFDHIPEWT